MSGSHHHCLTKHLRIEVDKINLETLKDQGVDDIVFIFEGWPLMLGENS